MSFFSRMTGFGRFCVIALIFAAIGGVIYYTGFNKTAAEYVNKMNGGEGFSFGKDEKAEEPQTKSAPVAEPAQKPVSNKVDAVIVAKAGYGSSPLLSGNAGFVSSDNSIVVKDYGLRMKMMVKNDDKSLCDALVSGQAQIGYGPSYVIAKSTSKDLKVFMEFSYNVGSQSSDCLIARADWLAKNKDLASKIAKAFIGVRTGEVKAK